MNLVCFSDLTFSCLFRLSRPCTWSTTADWDDVMDDEGKEGSRPLTEANKDEYVQAKVQRYLVASRIGPLQAMKRGFEGTPIAAQLKLFSAPELAAIVCGEQAVEGESICRVASFRGYPRTSVVPDAVREILTTWSAKGKLR